MRIVFIESDASCARNEALEQSLEARVQQALDAGKDVALALPPGRRACVVELPSGSQGEGVISRPGPTPQPRPEVKPAPPKPKKAEGGA